MISDRRPLAEAVVVCVGAAFMAAALLANQAWFDRHFLPSFWTPREDVVQIEQRVRMSIAVAGAVIILVLRKRGARFFAREPLHAITIPLAIVLAIGAAELVLRLRPSHENPELSERLRHFDPYLGCFLDASHTRRETHLGRDIAYIFDANGYRVGSPKSRVDFESPTVVFAGESIMTGLKLQWTQTIPAQVSEMLHVQSANVAVPGLATDQMYLRLARELPRFRHPVAVVSLFTPSLFDRNLDDDRPHLGPGLVWLPAVQHWRLATLARRVIGYRSQGDIDREVVVTREALAAGVALARSRAAIPLIVVPEFGPESPRERELRSRILDEGHLPYVLVTLDPDDRVENDGHPDADGARMTAEAIAEALQPAMPIERRR